jgi:hypothetical protein
MLTLAVRAFDVGEALRLRLAEPFGSKGHRMRV